VQGQQVVGGRRKAEFGPGAPFVADQCGSPIGPIQKGVEAGQLEAGRSKLAAARELIDKKFPDGLQNSGLASDRYDFWHDWLIAYLLLYNEAEMLVK
jgi:hypothetical protein